MNCTVEVSNLIARTQYNNTGTNGSILPQSAPLLCHCACKIEPRFLLLRDYNFSGNSISISANGNSRIESITSDLTEFDADVCDNSINARE